MLRFLRWLLAQRENVLTWTLIQASRLPKETVGRVRAVLIEMLINDNKEDEDIEDDDKENDDKENDDKENDDVHQLIAKQRRRM